MQVLMRAGIVASLYGAALAEEVKTNKTSSFATAGKATLIAAGCFALLYTVAVCSYLKAKEKKRSVENQYLRDIILDDTIGDKGEGRRKRSLSTNPYPEMRRKDPELYRSPATFFKHLETVSVQTLYPKYFSFLLRLMRFDLKEVNYAIKIYFTLHVFHVVWRSYLENPKSKDQENRMPFAFLRELVRYPYAEVDQKYKKLLDDAFAKAGSVDTPIELDIPLSPRVFNEIGYELFPEKERAQMDAKLEAFGRRHQLPYSKELLTIPSLLVVQQSKKGQRYLVASQKT